MSKWNDISKNALKQLYVDTDVTSDNLIADKSMLISFTNNLNNLVPGDVDFTPQEVAQELLRLRKSGKLPKIRH